MGFLFWGYIRRVLEFFKLVKTLPEYLRDMIGVKPAVDFSMNLPSKMAIRVGLRKEIMERESNLQEVIENYIHDFYPELISMKIDISIFELPDNKDKEEKSDNDS
jgi:hypothetical protein